MYKYIILCLCVSLIGVLCDLNKEEALLDGRVLLLGGCKTRYVISAQSTQAMPPKPRAECEWEGLTGKCVKESRCLTTLDENSPKHLICSEKDGQSIICCTDCQVVNNTNTALLNPTSGVYWKYGQKARYNCLQYLKDLPYQCKQDEFYRGISRALDEDNNCYRYGWWSLKIAPPPSGREPSAKYPHQVLIGFGDDLQTAKWPVGGFIISHKYIITAAHTLSWSDGGPKFLAMGVKKLSDPPASWQINKIKSITIYPEYKSPRLYHDIALIETDTPIKFDENVLPACLHVEEDAYVEDAVATTWFDLKQDTRSKLADTIQMIELEEFSEKECEAANIPSRVLKHGYDHTTQMCYGSKTDKTDPYAVCKGLSGEPLMVTTQFSSCVHTAIGISSYGRGGCGPDWRKPNVYTRVAHYVPWIESIVWP